MKFYKVLNVIVVLCFVLTLSFTGQPASAQEEPPGEPGEYMPGEVVVVFKPGKTLKAYAASAADLAGRTQTAAIKVSKEGMALLRGDGSVSIELLVEAIKQDADVLYAEPNYVYRIPDLAVTEGESLNKEFVFRQMKSSENGEEETLAIPISSLQSMKSVRGGKTMATYPNDPYLWSNRGWDVVDADIVSPNTTPSAGVCVLDTGVDYLHPDLSGKIIKGYDYVNGDADPMDDNGHGTHVAGIITANANNKIGIAGASNAKVVAVKVLGAQGWGTSYDIAMGINFCANRTDVKVLNMSLGGGYSQAITDAVGYAVNTKGKLVVAAAGNNNTSVKSYPAALSQVFQDKVLSVAASGRIVCVAYNDDDSCLYRSMDYFHRAEYSNYGDWVNIVAPGTDIYSTTPYDKPFYLNYFDYVYPRYDYMSGTSMAAPFVSAAAARRWGYKPKDTNIQVFGALVNSGYEVSVIYDDWPSSMAGAHYVNIANLLDRYEFVAFVNDASTGLALSGAAVQVYKGKTLLGSALVPPTDWYSTNRANVINLPAPPKNGTPYWLFLADHTYKVNKAGYTASPQEVFQHSQWRFGAATLYASDEASIPPKTSNVEVVAGWVGGFYWNPEPDLDLNVWLPKMPNPLDEGQFAPFIVGPWGYSYGYVEGDSSGSMNVFPFARYKRDGGWTDYLPIENLTISSRKAHGPVKANAALPYYPGDYVVGVTDYGQTFDHDGNSATPPVHVMGLSSVPYLYIWKDGSIQLFNTMWFQDPGGECNKQWWRGATISSGLTGKITYTPDNSCSNNPASIFPYW